MKSGIKGIRGEPLIVEWDVCQSATGKLLFETSETLYLLFSYNPLEFIQKHVSTCLEDGNLEINVDKRNALDTSFSEDGIQIFYILDGIETNMKLGSNNLTEENMKDKKNLHFKIRNKDGEIERNITESCEIRSEDGITASITGIVAGLVTLYFIGRASLKNTL